LNEIKMATNDAGRRWLRGLMREREKWSWAYDAGGWRYEFQTSNMADSFNNVLKGIRAMPINVIVSFSPSTGWLHGSMTDTHKQWHYRARTSYGSLNLCVILLRQRIELAHMRLNVLTT
jgi:hypothetical protein